MEKVIMNVRGLLITVLLLSIAIPAYGATDLSKLTRLEGVSLYADDSESRMVVRFNRVRGVKGTPQFFEKSIQIDIEGAYITPSKRNFDLGGKIIRLASAYQISPTKVRLRFFMDGDPREYAKEWKSSLNGDLMIITLKNLDQPASAIEAPAIEKKEEASDKPASTYKALYPPKARKFRATLDPDVVIEEEPKAPKKVARVEKHLASPATLNAGSKKSEKGSFPNLFAKKAEAGEVSDKETSQASPTEGFLNYKDPETPKAPSLTGMVIKMVTALCFTLAAVFFLAWAGKKYMGKFGAGFGRSSLINVLATSQIDVKKRIAVVDIAGEVLVLGIAGDNITMLSTIDDQEKADRFRQAGGHSFSGKGDEHLFAPIGEKIKASPISNFITKALNLTRIGRMKASDASRRSLFDANSMKTFEGNLAKFTNAPRPSEEESRKALGREADARQTLGHQTKDRFIYDKSDLVRKVTNAIKVKNGKLRIA